MSYWENDSNAFCECALECSLVAVLGSFHMGVIHCCGLTEAANVEEFTMEAILHFPPPYPLCLLPFFPSSLHFPLYFPSPFPPMLMIAFFMAF